MPDYDLPATGDVTRVRNMTGLLTIMRSVLVLWWRGHLVSRAPGERSFAPDVVTVTRYGHAVYLRACDRNTKMSFCSDPTGAFAWAHTRETAAEMGQTSRDNRMD